MHVYIIIIITIIIIIISSVGVAEFGFYVYSIFMSRKNFYPIRVEHFIKLYKTIVVSITYIFALNSYAIQTALISAL